MDDFNTRGTAAFPSIELPCLPHVRHAEMLRTHVPLSPAHDRFHENVSLRRARRGCVPKRIAIAVQGNGRKRIFNQCTLNVVTCRYSIRLQPGSHLRRARFPAGFRCPRPAPLQLDRTCQCRRVRGCPHLVDARLDTCQVERERSHAAHPDDQYCDQPGSRTSAIRQMPLPNPHVLPPLPNVWAIRQSR